VLGIPYDGVKVDIWALGVILYLLNSGKRPFVGSSIQIMYKNIININYSLPESFSPGKKYLTIELVDLISKIFVKDPSQRIDIKGICAHAWVVHEMGDVPLYKPKTVGNVNEAHLLKIISGIRQDGDFITYSLNPLARKNSRYGPVKAESKLDIVNFITRRRSASVAEPNGAIPTVVNVGRKSIFSHLLIKRDSHTALQSGPEVVTTSNSAGANSPTFVISVLDSKGTQPVISDEDEPLPQILETEAADFPTRKSNVCFQTELDRNHLGNGEIKFGGSKLISRRRSTTSTSRRNSINAESREFRRDSLNAESREAHVHSILSSGSSMKSSVEEPSFAEMEKWHKIHRPPKEIRMVRLPLTPKIVSSTDAAVMFQDLHSSLIRLSLAHNITFEREPSYYMFKVTYIPTPKELESVNSDSMDVLFEAEICRVSLLKIHALKTKRIFGDAFLYQHINDELMNEIEWTKQVKS
jgi:serine/threonine protein kinase